VRTETLSVSNPLWPDLLRSLRHDVYHTPEYVAIEARRSGHQGAALVISEGDQLLFLPYLLRTDTAEQVREGKSIYDVISPYGYPGILTSGSATCDPGFVARAMRLVFDYFADQGACSAFLRMHPILSPEFSHLDLEGISLRRRTSVGISLDVSEAAIWARTRKGHQSTINRCRRLGHHAHIGSWNEHGDAFRHIYRETMRHAGADDYYYFEDAYFNALQRLGDHIHLCVVETGGEIVAACLLFECCGIVQAHLGGTRDDHRTESPFSLLLHFARLWAKSRGNQVFHLGGGVGGADDPVFRYKSGFTRDRFEYVTARVVFDRARYEELVEARARSLNVDPAVLWADGFLPHYRPGA
jgi:CelD/BcsL family acetyltransferase involved in cellulose biosynthesis